MMSHFEPCIRYLSEEWKLKYGAILAEEHIQTLESNIRKFKEGQGFCDLPFFNEEIKINREESFRLLTGIIEDQGTAEAKCRKLEEVPFWHWLNILGQRITPASIRDERAVPPLRPVLIEACQKMYNSEITVAQRAWEKHTGRLNDPFWGEVKGSNNEKQQVVMDKIHYILDHQTWWNTFFHYRHELVFEVREREGHGIRWSRNGNSLIGFLEGFINE
ncbi:MULTISPECIES: hypothetical protein [Chryseobacterium]|uniref:Uncharacterized protein n=1 Tax=Chryseobacterium camelliae TaxID=1265445 RepID=A0ABU0TD31_9FLAO|nr:MULTISPECIES: hypothetical protein [Chryseobacterium]MDT3407230.1 hypothetical protein [Pseudacidovorax intermedius]MDQ1094980.1 hypothetical protein [Chryseobacterium camelliae]MDQ1098920.1 hypothetical protein [Chryseobacterium sp. SORGH_AS_1048]MDR6086268.1 hypothetical protein [Chryseobacterium sp. SORGH_AS_0909]MDR6130639.1 hypothetical protein [Chryseobacterium sp. SORGH_AS_1175]